MKIKVDILKYVADLARIELSEKQLQSFSAQLNTILEYIEKLNQLDTTKTEPMSHAMDIANVYRQDIIKESLSADEALKNAPLTKDGFFQVPKVIE